MGLEGRAGLCGRPSGLGRPIYDLKNLGGLLWAGYRVWVGSNGRADRLGWVSGWAGLGGLAGGQGLSKFE